ncbi:MAG TPA: thiol:disulfide interchange protein DsbA/DsbL [Burkholderiaceae bacterium]
MRALLLAALLGFAPGLALAQAASPPAAAPTDAAGAATTAPAGLAPRPGIDYEELPIPITPYADDRGRIEVAEVFSYACIHCAHFQPYVTAWRKSLPKDVAWQYVPAVFGAVWDNFARAYFAAERLGVLATTHDRVFQSVHQDHAISTGSLEDIADLYASYGVDRAKFHAAMNATDMDGRLQAARQFALRAGVSGTPTIVVAGRYRVQSTRDRGFEGMLATVDALIARERAARAAAAKSAPATR